MGILLKAIGSLMIIAAFATVFGALVLTGLPSAGDLEQLGLIAEQRK